MALRTISLCTGVGGLDLGLDLGAERVGLGGARAVCMVEGEAFAVANLAGAMEAGSLAPAPIWSDVKTFDARPWRGVVDLVTAGYPCQPFSVAGKGLGEEDERHLWPDVARVIGECEPALVFLENVANHLGSGFDEVAGDLRGMGYRIAATLWTAEEVGAPHVRRRFFCLAANADSEQLRQFAERHTPRWYDFQRCWEAKPGHDGSWWGAARSPYWFVEPRVDGAGDDVADRLDRLRLCGNGVVPLQAAAAFRELLESLALGGCR